MSDKALVRDKALASDRALARIRRWVSGGDFVIVPMREHPPIDPFLASMLPSCPDPDAGHTPMSKEKAAEVQRILKEINGE